MCDSAICGLLRNTTSAGTLARNRRAASPAQLSGRYNRHATGRLAVAVATDSETATWQLSCLPSCPQYCRATPTECRPFLGKPVSSIIHPSTGPAAAIAGRTASRTARSRTVSSHGDWPTKCKSDWCSAAVRSGRKRAAIGSTLLRSPGNSKPVQYERNGPTRSACPSARDNLTTYLEKRSSPPLADHRRSIADPISSVNLA
jgi:hypothetical protein